ncbi:MAG: phospholipase [Bacteroidota bacterium]
MIQQNSLKVTRTAHYYTIGTITPKTKHFVIACHGYGQLAKHFIRKFDVVANEETFIIAPEGLSRFYWKGVTGEVAASWMTKEDRLDEIADYSNYLQQIYDNYAAQLSDNATINLFGFSQGCATQCRWIMHNQPYFHNLILWAGFFPEDLNYLPRQDYFSDKKLYFAYGDQDCFLTPPRLKMHEELIKQNQLEVQVFPFLGKHEVNRERLKEFWVKLND